jgi:cAMP-dependent protein kinase regulator
MDLTYFLKNLPAFEDFKAPHLTIFASHLQVEEQADGHTFIQQGQQGKALYLLLQGSVRITRHEDNSDVDYEVRELADGELFGILSLVQDLPAQATCTAKGSVKVASLDHASFQQLFNEASPIGHHLQYMIAVQMARDLQEANKRLRNALTAS